MEPKHAVALAVLLAVLVSSMVSVIITAGLGAKAEERVGRKANETLARIEAAENRALARIQDAANNALNSIYRARDEVLNSIREEAAKVANVSRILAEIEEAKNKAVEEVAVAARQAVENITSQVHVIAAELRTQNATLVLREVREKQLPLRTYHILFNMTVDFGLRVTDKPANVTLVFYVNDIPVFNKTLYYPSVLYQHYPPLLANITVAAAYIAKVGLYVDAWLGTNEHIVLNATKTNPYPPTETELAVKATPHLAPLIRHITLDIQPAKPQP